MRLADARYVWLDKIFPALSINIDGKPAKIICGETKPNLLNAGLVFVGAEFSDSLPTIAVPGDLNDGRSPLTLRGFTNNAIIFRMYNDMLDAADDGSFEERSVLIPEA
jgi:hypothetical protein